MQITFSLLRRFEGLRAVAYLAVACGIFSGPTAAFVTLRPQIFVELDLSKVFFLVVSFGAPVLLLLTLAFLFSDMAGSPFEKPDLSKSVPGSLAAASICATFIHLFSLIMAGGDLHRYLWGVPSWALCAGVGVLSSGFADRLAKVRRAKLSSSDASSGYIKGQVELEESEK